MWISLVARVASNTRNKTFVRARGPKIVPLLHSKPFLSWELELFCLIVLVWRRHGYLYCNQQNGFYHSNPLEVCSFYNGQLWYAVVFPIIAATNTIYGGNFIWNNKVTWINWRNVFFLLCKPSSFLVGVVCDIVDYECPVILLSSVWAFIIYGSHR